jgi:hypothetical protein
LKCPSCNKESIFIGIESSTKKGGNNMKIESLDKLKQDIDLFEKILLAYWHSIPSDTDRFPTKIKIKFETNNFFGGDLYNDDLGCYGYSTFTKRDLVKYIDKLNSLKLHEDDIHQRIDRETN